MMVPFVPPVLLISVTARIAVSPVARCGRRQNAELMIGGVGGEIVIDWFAVPA